MRIKHFFILLLVACLAACGGGSNKFKVAGKLSDMPEQTVYLEELGIDKIIVVDSSRSDKTGAFTLAGNAPEPGLYRLKFSGSPNKFIIFSIEKDNITVDGDWNAVETVKFGNSPSSESLSKFLAVVRGHMRDFNTMGIVMDSLKAKGNDSMLAIAESDIKEMNFQLTRYIEQYADTVKYLPNAIFAVQILNPVNELEFYKVFLQNMNSKFGDRRMAKEFTAKFNNVMKQMGQPGVGTADVGGIAPEIKLPDANGKEITLSSLRGKYVLVDFWASWCGPCRRENPNVVAAYNKFKTRNFTILGVSLDDDKDKWLQAVSKDGLTWMHISDLKGWESVAAANYGVQSIPANFLVDPSGKIIARDLRGEDLEGALAELVK